MHHCIQIKKIKKLSHCVLRDKVVGFFFSRFFESEKQGHPVALRIRIVCTVD